MNQYAKLAWRNLWRNKRRTIITAASIFFGVILSSVMSSMQEGSYDSMVENAVNYYSGYIQVMDSDYWENKTINNSIALSSDLKQKIENTQHVTMAFPRIESFALASSEKVSKAVMVMGIVPEEEKHMTRINEKIVTGNYIDSTSNGAMLASDLAEYLNLNVGDTLVMISQGYHGVSAFGLFPVEGVFKHPSPSLNRQLVLLNIKTAEEFYAAYGRASSMVVMVDDNDNTAKATKSLRDSLKDNFSVMTWDEMQPTLIQQIESDRGSGNIMKGILYMVIAFGILGTILMMMAERKYEFGVLVAIGMKRIKLSMILVVEIIFIGFLGTLAGIAGSIPINYYFYNNPIPLSGQAAEMMNEMGFEPVMYFTMAPEVFYIQAIVVFIVTIFLGVIPLVHLSRLNIVNALKR